MTKAEAATLGGQATALRYAERRHRLRELLAEGIGLKRAAWEAGVSVRTARRVRKA